MTTTTNVQQVKVNKVTQAQYDSMTKNDNEFYVIVDKEYITSVNNIEPVNGNVTLSIPEEVFIAEYAVTSYADILSAINNGKQVIAKNGTYQTGLFTIGNGYINFNILEFGNNIVWQVSSSGWVSTGKSFPDMSVQTVQGITTLSSGTITLTDANSLYVRQPSAATTFTFTNSTSASSTKAYTFELCIKMPTTVYGITWPSSVHWLDGEIPDLSETGTYLLAFRTMDGGSTWLGNLQGKWN